MKHRELTPHNVLVVGGVIAFAALWLSVVIGIAVVVIHFVTKFW